ncbi:MAG: arylsulfatase [Pseudomonadota bacterium]
MIKQIGALLLSAGLLTGLVQAQDSASPNVVIILIDDAGLMDLGVYGGEARTPNIDALAKSGAMFTQYRTSPLCSPTRAMLLTGLDNHLTGVATIPEVLPAEHKGKPGYSMALEPGVLTLADRLGAAGYRTLMTGKWHLGEAAEEMPHMHGFQRSFALAASGADNWQDKSYMPYYADAPWWEDGKEVALPDDFYSSEFIVDKMIEYLQETDQSKPFLAYLPFQAIHIPVQAPAEFTANYDGVYDQGWHVLRQTRYEIAQEIGLIAEGAPLAPMPADARDWNSLTAEEHALYTAMMEVNAGMLEAMDHHIGRFIDHLKSAEQFENSIFIVASDNGPEFNRGDDDHRITLWQSLNGYNIDPERAGLPGSWGFIGPEWANAAASPGALYKFYATEGGVRSPLIISGPGIDPISIDSPAMVTDIAPTLIDWIKPPEAPSDSKPMTGRSLLPVLRGDVEAVYAHDDIRAIEVSGNTALYKGDYKITRSMPPAGDATWGLFNMRTDPGETSDLREMEPEMLAEMLAAYDDYARQVGVLEMPEGYHSLEQILDNTTPRLLKQYRWYLVGIALLFLILAYAIYRGVRLLLKGAGT